jgi:serine O-acetyltransferase
VTPERLWWWSTRLHRRGFTPLAKLLKLVNFLVFKTVLPYECSITPDVTLMHRGLGTVIHPNSTIGRRVTIGHNVTLAAGSQETDAAERIIIEDDVFIGTGAWIGARTGASLRIGQGAVVGALAAVTRDVPAGATMIGPTARRIDERSDGDSLRGDDVTARVHTASRSGRHG